MNRTDVALGDALRLHYVFEHYPSLHFYRNISRNCSWNVDSEQCVGPWELYSKSTEQIRIHFSCTVSLLCPAVLVLSIEALVDFLMGPIVAISDAITITPKFTMEYPTPQ
jgi:hypothetical protein